MWLRSPICFVLAAGTLMFDLCSKASPDWSAVALPLWEPASFSSIVYLPDLESLSSWAGPCFNSFDHHDTEFENTKRQTSQNGSYDLNSLSKAMLGRAWTLPVLLPGLCPAVRMFNHTNDPESLSWASSLSNYDRQQRVFPTAQNRASEDDQESHSNKQKGCSLLSLGQNCDFRLM